MFIIPVPLGREPPPNNLGTPLTEYVASSNWALSTTVLVTLHPFEKTPWAVFVTIIPYTTDA